jgi:hypothetical protein
MAVIVIVTANHYVLDVIGGVLISAACVRVARRIRVRTSPGAAGGCGDPWCYYRELMRCRAANPQSYDQCAMALERPNDQSSGTG